MNDTNDDFAFTVYMEASEDHTKLQAHDLIAQFEPRLGRVVEWEAKSNLITGCDGACCWAHIHHKVKFFGECVVRAELRAIVDECTALNIDCLVVELKFPEVDFDYHETSDHYEQRFDFKPAPLAKPMYWNYEELPHIIEFRKRFPKVGGVK